MNDTSSDRGGGDSSVNVTTNAGGDRVSIYDSETEKQKTQRISVLHSQHRLVNITRDDRGVKLKQSSDSLICNDERANGHRPLVRVLTASVVSFAALPACKHVAGVIETTTRHRV